MQRVLTQQFGLHLAATALLMHVFCCGLPILLSVGSLATVLGVQAEWFHPEWLHAYEMPLIIITGVVLLLTGLVQYAASRINCRTDGQCHHKPCDKKKRLAQRLYWVALGLFSVNLVVFTLSH